MDDRLHDHYHAWYLYFQETVYDDRSFVTEVRDANGQKWWSDPAYNEQGQLTSYLAGNVLETTREFDPATHLPERIYVKPVAGGSNLLDHRYAFDRQGNLIQRSDGVQDITETIDFDNLNRLTGTTVVGVNTTKVTYDDFGNIKNRNSGSGPGQVDMYDYFNGTHRVHTAGDRTFAYNKNGSITSVTISANDPELFN